MVKMVDDAIGTRVIVISGLLRCYTVLLVLAYFIVARSFTQSDGLLSQRNFYSRH